MTAKRLEVECWGGIFFTCKTCAAKKKISILPKAGIIRHAKRIHGIKLRIEVVKKQKAGGKA